MAQRPIDYAGYLLDVLGKKFSKTPISQIPGAKIVYSKIQEKIKTRQYEAANVPQKITYRGKLLYVFPNSEWAKQLYVEGRFSVEDEHEWDIFRKHISAGDTVFDVGAFVGTHSILMYQLVGDTGRVYAFEPQPECADLIQKTFTVNNMENCTVANKAAGAETTVTSLQTSEAGETTSNIVGSDPWKKHDKSVDVEMIRLDEYMDKNQVQTVDFMKIDVQGAGLEVIKGLGEKLHDVEVIYIEIHSKYIVDTTKTVEELFEILNDYGNIIRLDTNDQQVIERPEEITFDRRQPDILWM